MLGASSTIKRKPVVAPNQATVGRVTFAEGLDHLNVPLSGCMMLQEEGDGDLPLPVAIHVVFRPGRGICPVHSMAVQGSKKLASELYF